MIFIDFLFKICYAPFAKVKNGRFAALIWLVPPLTFISVGIIKVILYYVRSVAFLKTTPIIIAILCLTIGAFLFYYLDKTYVKNMRHVGNIRFPILCAFVIFLMLVFSLIFFSIALAKFK